MRYPDISLFATALFVTLLTVLHFIKPELDPSWRFISEYALGSWGWLMQIAFFAWGTAYIALFLSLRGQFSTMLGKVGMVSLLVSACGTIIAGVFPSDPVTAEIQTSEGQLHTLGGTLGIAMPVAAGCIGFAVARMLPGDSTWLRRFSVLAVAASVVSMVSLGFMIGSNDGKITPDIPVGYPTRFEVVAYCTWLLVAAWKAKSLTRPSTATVQ